jgi:hypothetical protein
MRIEYAVLALAGLLETGCSFTPTQLNADPVRFSGETVVVRGYVFLAPGVHVLCASRAPFLTNQNEMIVGKKPFDVNQYEKYCMTIENPEVLYIGNATADSKSIVLRGKFNGNCKSRDTRRLDLCTLPTSIVIDNRALVREYPSHSTKRP